MTVMNLEVRSHPHVKIIADRCAGCQECVIRCPVGALSMDVVTWTARASDDACVGCRQCVRTCPFGAITVEGPMLVSDRVDPPVHQPETLFGNVDETRVGFASWDEALVEANRCLSCLDPTCVRGCPAHNDIPGFIDAIRDRDLIRAHEILRRTTVMPDICSRVCNQSAQCEGACTWSLAGAAPVAIGRLERFITDNEPVPALSRSVDAAPDGSFSVGIIGSGPAGVGAAWELLEAGAQVTVYEKESTPGGLCVWGMPDFTLPDDVARRPWLQLCAAGVNLRCSTDVAADELGPLLQVHDAVVVAIGAGVAMRHAVPGAELDGVVNATTFLQGAKNALEPEGDPTVFLAQLGITSSARVLVLGAGNTAMDVARMARRLGFTATCVDWLNERFAQARPDELSEARDEGVEVRFQRTLTGLQGIAGRVVRANLALTEQTVASRNPQILQGEGETLEVDLVVVAMGYRSDPSFAKELPGTPVRKWSPAIPDRRWIASGILANSASSYAHRSPVGALALARESGLWAAALAFRDRLWVVGDALTGPSTVVEAMAQGRQAARAILDAQPTRPNNEVGRASTRVLVCYASQGGMTARAASEIGEHLRERGIDLTLLPIEQVGAPELAHADLLIVGTWVEGLIVTRVHPARAMREWLGALPHLGERPVAVFCTFGVHPRGSLAQMRRAIEAKGGVVIREASFGPHDLKGETLVGPVAFATALVSILRHETSVRVAAR